MGLIWEYLMLWSLRYDKVIVEAKGGLDLRTKPL
jgi:hypothetical protein